MDKKYQISLENIETIVEWAHSYGRSEQFNYGLFGPDSKQAIHFTKEKATEYIKENIISNLGEI